MRNRVLGRVPEPTRKGLSMLRAEARRIGRQLPSTPTMSVSSFVNHYSGKRRTRYEQAAKDLKARPLTLPRDAEISAFVKSEKFNPGGKVNPDPRMIQARNARYNIAVGVYLKPIEHELYRMKSERTGLPLLAKGLCPRRRGEVIAEIWHSFQQPCAVSLDGSRWDQHIDIEVLKVEHEVYRHCNNDPYFAELLSQQLYNNCKTFGGWRYKAKGKRMSGDMNTALGNCLLMVLMARAYFQSIEVEAEIFDDGDDVLVFFESANLPKVKETVTDCFLQFGQEVKVENIANRLEDIVFCQSSPIKVGAGYMMVADWRKIISQSTSGTRFWSETKTRADMAYSVGQCLLALYPGVPIIQSYAVRLCAFGGKINPAIYDTDWLWKIRPLGSRVTLGELGPEPITPETRNSFAAAYKVPQEQQMLLERMLDHWTLPLELEDYGDEVYGEWQWEYPLNATPTPWEW